MRRSTWTAVLVTVALLAAAGNVSRLDWSAARTGLGALASRAVAAWPRLQRTHSPRPVSGAVAPRVDGVGDAPHAGPRHTPVAPARLLVTTMASDRPLFVPRAQPLPRGVVPAAAGLVALVLALATAVRARGSRRDRRGRVWRLARRGLTPDRISRGARVPRDAVRTLLVLVPGLGPRR